MSTLLTHRGAPVKLTEELPNPINRSSSPLSCSDQDPEVRLGHSLSEVTVTVALRCVQSCDSHVTVLDREFTMIENMHQIRALD